MTWLPRTEPTPIEAERIAYANGDPNAPLLAQVADAPDAETLTEELIYLRDALSRIVGAVDLGEAISIARDALAAPD